MSTAPENTMTTNDPNVWADEFIRQNGGDQDVMTAWFDAAMTAAKP